MIGMFFRNKSFLFKLRLAWISIILVIVLIFLILSIAPFGRATYVKNYAGQAQLGKGFISNFRPIEKLDTKSGDLPRLIDSTTYFSVFTPRTFSDVKLTIKYRTHQITNEDKLKIGVLIDPRTFYYNLKPLENNSGASSVEFNLKGVYRDNNQYSFAIVLPDLKMDDNLDDYLEIIEMKLEFSGRTLKEKIFGSRK